MKPLGLRIDPLERLYFHFHILFIATFFFYLRDDFFFSAFFFCFSGDLDSDLNILFIAAFFLCLSSSGFFRTFFFSLYTLAGRPGWYYKA